MKKLSLLSLITLVSLYSVSQNIGIGTTNPGAKLHIASGLSGYSGGYFPGMVVEGSTNSYINLLTPTTNENGILFGTTLSLANGGIIYNNSLNPNGFQFRTNGNATRVVIDNNGRIGIGNTSPNAPLSFPPTLEKKITLYPGATGDVGFGVAGNRLQIYSDNPNADVAFGYDAAGTFNERFSFKPNGAFAVNGTTGQTGQVLQSNGPGSAAAWVSPTHSLYDNTVAVEDNGTQTVSSADNFVDLTGMSYTFTVSGNAKLYVNFNVPVITVSCFSCGFSSVFVDIDINGSRNSRWNWNVANGILWTCTGSQIIPLTAGTYTIKLQGANVGNNTEFGGGLLTTTKRMNLQIITQ